MVLGLTYSAGECGLIILHHQNKYANPLNTSTSNYPSQDIYNKGTTAIGEEWVVLQANPNTTNEWKYLFERKDLSNNLLLGSATISITGKDITGVVVLPDDWVTPDDIEFKPGYGDWRKNPYDEKQWKIMEAAGAVFLPNAGQRSGESFSTVNGPGYWSSTSYDASNVYYYSVNNSQGKVSKTSPYIGKPVRLVRVLN